MTTAERLKGIRDHCEMLSECKMRFIKETYDWATRITSYEFLDSSVLTCGDHMVKGIACDYIVEAS